MYNYLTVKEVLHLISSLTVFFLVIGPDYPGEIYLSTSADPAGRERFDFATGIYSFFSIQ